jgi:hypothetical protein
MRLSAEEKGERVFDALSTSVGLDIHQLAMATKLSRGSVYHGIRWLRDTLGDEALVCNNDIYELALTTDGVVAYRAWTLQYIVTRLKRHQKVLEAGEVKFGVDPDAHVGIEMIRTGVLMLERALGAGARGASSLERAS